MGGVGGTTRIAALLALALLFAAGAAEAPAADDAPRCHGRRATIVGTAADDALRGTPERDVIWGGPGNDAIYSQLGNDLVCGGAGDDVVHGGRGNDEAFGGRGTDRVFGDLGDDKAVGGPGSGDDVSGGLGIDTVNGGPGDHDLVHGDYGYDRMSGGPGKHDVASFATSVSLNGTSGVWASLRAHVARGDGHDKLYEFEDLEGSAFRDTLTGDGGPNEIRGGPGNDTLFGGGGPGEIRGGPRSETVAGGADALDGGAGTDGCRGAPGRTASCGPERRLPGSAYVQVDAAPGGGGGVQIVGGRGDDELSVEYEVASGALAVDAAAGLAAGPGCEHRAGGPDPAREVRCPLAGPARWLVVDLGPGEDRFAVRGSLAAVGFVRVHGGRGDDAIRGGPEDDLLQAGPGADKLYGGPGADGLVGGVPGPTFLHGGPGGDLLAAGGGCAGGALVGGGGRDDASFAEVGYHPGRLIVSFPRHSAWVTAVPGCHRVHLSPTDEDMEGSFGPDVLIGNGRRNAILGQPGKDVFFGNGGDDVIDARDGFADVSIRCGRDRPEGRALVDAGDPRSHACAKTKQGTPVPGLHG